MLNYQVLDNFDARIIWEPVVQTNSLNKEVVLPKVTYYIFYEFDKKFDLESIQTICQLSKLRSKRESDDKESKIIIASTQENSYIIKGESDEYK